jgi:hypothetical protein
MSTMSRVRAIAILLPFVAALLVPSVAAAQTVDCFADGVGSYNVSFNPPESGYRVPELPGIVLGPPGDSFPTTGSTSVVSLGHNGWILLVFADNVIVDGPGPDFIVFENAFFKSFVPSDPNQAYSVFAEPGSVAVSDDGITFHQFPYDPNALQFVGQDSTPSSTLPLLRGLSGITPTFTGNWTIPDDPNVWDPNGRGGVSGAGGDAFDLATVGLSSARYVLITDLGLNTGFAGSAEGFDLDAVVARNSIPAPLAVSGRAGGDTDGDGLPDIDETIWYGSDPNNPDTDSDGVPDGVEAARCHSLTSSSIAPSFIPQLDLLVLQASGSTDTFVTWNFISSSATYDVVRGDLPATPGPLPGNVICIEDNSFNLTTSDHFDTGVPSPGHSFFYLARVKGETAYGKASDGSPRTFTTGDCPL